MLGVKHSLKIGINVVKQPLKSVFFMLTALIQYFPIGSLDFFVY